MVLAVFLLTILGGTALNLLVERLNLSRLTPEIPAEFGGVYDAAKYARAQEYLRENTRADLVRSVVVALVMAAFIALGGFGVVDQFARSVAGLQGPIWTGLVFMGSLGALSWLLGLPFRIHNTFGIEQRFGFNTTTPRTFVLDQLRALLLAALLGGPLLAGIFWFFQRAGDRAWLWSWIGVTVFQLLVVFLAPVLLLPLFNKFTPLPAGELRAEIEAYARGQQFQLQGIFSMDGSKRSTKANAFFTGFGAFRRIVLFDTLMKTQTTPELVAVLAHEVGHFKRGHIRRQLALGILTTGLMFWLLSFFVAAGDGWNAPFFRAVGLPEPTVYAGLALFGILYAPLSRVVGLYGLHLSRKYEFEADDYSADTYGKPAELGSALKKLSVDSLSNLHPHWLKVLTEYTHPPVLERLARLRTRVPGTSA